MTFKDEDKEHLLQLRSTEARGAVVFLIGRGMPNPTKPDPVLVSWVAQVLQPEKSFFGWFCAPGGKAASGETTRRAAVRECFEETGVRLEAEDLYYCGFVVTQDSAQQYIVALYLAEVPAGEEVKRMEPEKLGPWQMHELEDIRTLNLTPGTAALASIAQALYSMPPVPMELFCPNCEQRHVDQLEADGTDWSKKPHRTHLCHGCGHLWRPRDSRGQVLPYPTVGVVEVAAVVTVCSCGATEENARRALQHGPFIPVPHLSRCPSAAFTKKP